jgi:hypothetical protein
LYEHRWLIGADGQPLYGNVNLYRGEAVGSHPELWPLIIEKAYAQWKGGYQVIGQGGFTTDTEEALTGHEASQYFVSDYQPHEIGHRIHAAQREGKAVTASTATMPSDMTVVRRGQSAGEGVGNYHGHDVAYAHAYAVEHVEEDVDSISLQNPWGHDHIEDMSLPDFKHTFNSWETDRT